MQNVFIGFASCPELMKWETVSQSQVLVLFEMRGMIIWLAVLEETKQKYVFEPCLDFPNGWINPATIYPDIYLISVVVNCNELILLEPG